MFGYDWPRLHAALNDLPAALLLAAVLFDLLSAALKRPSLRIAGFWTVLAGAVGGVLAVLSGLQAENHIAHGEAVHELMETHEHYALITLAIFAVVALWRLVRESRMEGGERGGVLLLSVIGVGFLLVTASYGGRMVFDHAAGVPTPVLQEEMHERAEGHHHHGGEADEDADHDHGDDHDHAAPSIDSAPPTNGPGAGAIDTTPHGHSHPPGTPPHKD
jgi:uncharacterized membrane protein